MKRFFLCLLAFFAVQLGYLQVTLSADEVVIATTEMTSASSTEYFVVTGQENLVLNNGYAGGRYTVYGWLGPAKDPRLEKLYTLSVSSYKFAWSIEPMGTTAYIYGNGPYADVSIYSNTSGNVRIHCEVSSSSGSYLGVATGYIYF